MKIEWLLVPKKTVGSSSDVWALWKEEPMKDSSKYLENENKRKEME